MTSSGCARIRPSSRCTSTPESRRLPSVDIRDLLGVPRAGGRTEIYAAGIATGNATFETEVPAWEAWDTSHMAAHRLRRVRRQAR